MQLQCHLENIKQTMQGRFPKPKYLMTGAHKFYSHELLMFFVHNRVFICPRVFFFCCHLDQDKERYCISMGHFLVKFKDCDSSIYLFVMFFMHCEVFKSVKLV